MRTDDRLHDPDPTLTVLWRWRPGDPTTLRVPHDQARAAERRANLIANGAWAPPKPDTSESAKSG